MNTPSIYPSNPILYSEQLYSRFYCLVRMPDAQSHELQVRPLSGLYETCFQSK